MQFLSSAVREEILSMDKSDNSFANGVTTYKFLKEIEHSNPNIYAFKMERLEAAEKLGVSLNTVELLDTENEIDRVRKYLITEDMSVDARADIDEYIKSLEDWITLCKRLSENVTA